LRSRKLNYSSIRAWHGKKQTECYYEGARAQKGPARTRESKQLLSHLLPKNHYKFLSKNRLNGNRRAHEVQINHARTNEPEMDNNGRHIKIEKLPDWFPSRQGLSYDHEGFYRITDFD